LGQAFAFPGLADVFELRDEYHTSTPGDEAARVLKFVGQVGSFMWSFHGQPALFEEEYEVVRQIFGVCYRKLGLNPRGSLPGHKHRSFGEGLPLAVPPISVDFCSYDWAEYLWDNAVERWALLPVATGPILLPPYEEGLLFSVSEGALVNVLEDLSCLQKIRMVTEWLEVSVTNKRSFRLCLSRSPRTYLCRYLDHCPAWFSDVASSKERVPMYYGL